MVLYTTLKSNDKFFMDLTNIDAIKLFECITVFTEIASKLSGKLHFFCPELSRGKKKIGNVTVKNYLKGCCLFGASLFTVKVLSKRV